MRTPHFAFLLAHLALPVCALAQVRSLGIGRSADATYQIEVVADSLREPVSLAFLPNYRALLAERMAGRISLLDLANGRRTAVGGLPALYTDGDGGVLDLLVHPQFARNQIVFVAYTIALDTGQTMVVDRARLDGTQLIDRQRIFTALPAVTNNSHFGGRLALRDSFLFVSVGDRQAYRHLAQDLTAHVGKIIRLHDDGRVPVGNPYTERAGARPELWSIGHRNPQGLAVHPVTGQLWSNEHGPLGGDEINIVLPGRNYGWPLVSFGREYSGAPIAEGRSQRAGIENPVHLFTPSIGPSGMAFFTGDAFAPWRGSLFLGALAHRHLNRLVFNAEGRIVREERLLQEQRWRVREVRQGPDGALYLGVDEGLLIRLRPLSTQSTQQILLTLAHRWSDQGLTDWGMPIRD
jgi:glucose/arabinose dehydrogenase